MSAKTVVKALVSVAVTVAVSAAFFGAPTAFACRVQPAATVAFLVALALTPVFGRLFCECLCPLGCLQSLVNLLFHPRRKVRRVCTRLPESLAQRVVRWSVLALFALAAAAGFGALSWSITPYSIFGKALSRFAPGVALFAAILAAAAFGKGRFWCNWVCPAGTLFGVLSRKSLLAHKVGGGCANCRACFERRGEGGSGEAEASGVTRREAVKCVAALAAADVVEKTTDGGFAPVSLPGVPRRAAPVLPPGAAERAEFSLKCVGCGLCISVCRGDCLSASLELKRFGQPEMDFRRGHCLVGCSGECGRVCPTGAIAKLTGVDRMNVHIGRATLRNDLCIRSTKGVECTACTRKCPAKAIHIVEGFPVVDAEACIGCGACEHVCPARPMPAIFVEGLERQRIVSPIAKRDLVAEMRRLLEEGASLVVARGGVIVAVERGRGIGPLLKALDSGALADAVVVDKVIGRAAAAVCALGRAAEVVTPLAAEGAADLLAVCGASLSADQTVRTILNRDKSGSCPMERAVSGLSEPAGMVAAVRSTLEKMERN